MSEEYVLLPCPFCGARPVFVYRDDGGDGYSSRTRRTDAWDLQCNTPDCYLEHGADMWTTKEDAAAMWNARPRKVRSQQMVYYRRPDGTLVCSYQDGSLGPVDTGTGV